MDRTLYPLTLAHLTALHLPPAELVELAGRTGYAAVALRVSAAAPGSPVYPLPTASTALRELKRVLDGEGVRVSDIELLPLTPGLIASDAEALLATGAELGAASLIVTGDDPDTAALTRLFGELCDRAAPYGLRIDLEFMRWRPVATLADALRVVRGAGRANGSVLLDVLHHFRAGGAVSDLADLPKGMVRAVQISDAPRDLPDGMGVIEEARGARLPPGEGELPILDALRAMPRPEFFAVELPMDLTRPGWSLPERARRGCEATQALLARLDEKAGAS